VGVRAYSLSRCSNFYKLNAAFTLTRAMCLYTSDRELIVLVHVSVSMRPNDRPLTVT